VVLTGVRDVGGGLVVGAALAAARVAASAAVAAVDGLGGLVRRR
jgi:uncharacterized protein (TIGR03382 family)